MNFGIHRWLAAWALVLLAACGGGGDREEDPSSSEVRCGTLGLTPKVFNGTECVDSAGSPVVPVAVFYVNDQAALCSGTVLSPTRVLTAAHCLPTDTSAVRVWGADRQPVVVSDWVEHPSFNFDQSGFRYDAAILTLESPLSNPPMALLTSIRAAPGQAAFIAGWGLTAPSGSTAFDFDELTFDNTGDLVIGNVSLTFVDPLFIGFVYTGVNSETCQGDSGGPLYRSVGGRMGLLGITSFGSSAVCGGNGRSVYTNVQNRSILDFILEHAPDAQTF